MSTTKNINNLVINKVESQEVYDYLLSNGMVNDDELYFVQGDSSYEDIASQSDWNQNNSNEPDYVKNRTHWISEGTEVIIPQTSQFSIRKDKTGDYNWEPEYDYDKQYIVTVDGVQYRCTPYELDDGYGMPSFTLGDSRLRETPDDSHPEDVPFLVQAYIEDDGANGYTMYHYWLFSYSTSGTHTIEITELTGELDYHTLDERFIPDTVATKNFVSAKIAEAQLNGGDVDLSGYATKDDLSGLEAEVDDKIVAVNAYVDEKFNNVATSHNHNSIYYTETEVDTLLANKSDTGHKHDSDYDSKGSATEALNSAKEYSDANLKTAKSYADTKVSGLASSASVDNKISTHNTSTSAHNDIRVLIKDLTTKLNSFLDVNDSTADQLSEVLTMIENNKGTLESLTTSKVNVSDIIDNLTTSSTTKVLSAKQGVAIKSLIDALQKEVNNKASGSHSHTAEEVGAAPSTHTHSAADVTSGTLSSSRLPTVPITKGGTGATTAAGALTNLGITATAAELNYVDGVTSNIQTQLDKKFDITAGGSKVIGANEDLNDYTTPDVYVAVSATAASLANCPASTGFMMVVMQGYSSNYISQTIFVGANNNVFYRSCASSTWTNWINLSKTTLSDLGITATAAELNKLDGVTATTTELNYVDGVTSNIQTQLNAKQGSITGGATTIASDNLTASRALISNSSGKVAVSAVTSTELGYLDGVTSAIQTQLNGKASSTHNHSASEITSGTLSSDRLPTVPVAKGGTGATSAVVADYNLHKDMVSTDTAITDNTQMVFKYVTPDSSKGTLYYKAASHIADYVKGKVALSDLGVTATAAELNKLDGVTATTAELNKLDGVTATTAELNYLDGVTSAIQTQLNNRLPVNIGTAIASNSDLNTFTTPGKYYSGASSISSTLTNSPSTSTGFGLIVMDGYIDGRVYQFALLSNNSIRMRYYNGTSWSPWAYILTNILQSSSYGTSLPAAGTAGRIFFKKV